MGTSTEVLVMGPGDLEETARKTASVLLGGGVSVIPTDTVYGIVALDQFPESVERIYGIKGRPRSKPFIRLIGRLGSLSLYTEQSLPEELGRHWPGPLTVVFRAKGGGTVAVRFPEDPFLGALFTQLGGRPLVAPSANLSGEGEIHDAGELVRVFAGKVDLIVCVRGGLIGRRPSTIVDISGPGWKVVRPGALPIDPQALGPSH